MLLFQIELLAWTVVRSFQRFNVSTAAKQRSTLSTIWEQLLLDLKIELQFFWNTHFYVDFNYNSYNLYIVVTGSSYEKYLSHNRIRRTESLARFDISMA